MTQLPAYRSCLQKSDCVERLLYIGYLLRQARGLALHRCLHELVFSVQARLSATRSGMPGLSAVAQRAAPIEVAAEGKLRAGDPAIASGAARCPGLLLHGLTSSHHGDSRDHLLELVHGRFNVGPGCDIVLDLVDERRVRYASRVGGRIFAGGAQP